MKRILSLFIVLVIMLGTLASCELPFFTKPQNTEPTKPVAEEANIQDVVDYLEEMYGEDKNGTSTSNDFTLPSALDMAADGSDEVTEFTIVWTSSTDKVTLTLNEEQYNYLVQVPVNNDTTEEYTLTATITSPKGQSAEVTITRVLTASYGMITNPVAGQAYKFALLHGNEKAVVYFDGNNYNNYAWYLAYTQDVLAAVDVYLEEVEGVEGGYRLYFDLNGEKTYIVAFPRDGDTTKGTLKLDSAVPTEYYTYSSEYNTLIYTSTTGEQFYIGSSGTYKSISLSSIDYITGATSYVAHLYGPGGIVEELPEQTLPEVPENYTSEDVVNALYQLEVGQTLEGPYLITGVVTSIKYAFDPAYSNVSVVIQVGDLADKPVLLYRIKGEGADTVKVGDTITVRSGVTNYNGTFETVSGGLIEELIPGEGGNTPVVPPVTDATEMTIPEVLAAAEGTKVIVKGTVKSFKYAWDDGFGNCSPYIVDDNGNELLCFRLSTKVNVGDQITVTGTVTAYNGVNQLAQGCTAVIDVPAGGGNTDGDYASVVVDTPYYLHMVLPSGTVYFKGAMDGNYLATTTDKSLAVAIYFEEVDGGYHIYFMDGETKTYITAAAYLKNNGYAGCHFSLTTETPTLAWTYNTTYGIIEIYDEVEGKSDTFFAGTYGSYSTISLSGSYYKDQISSGGQYPARLEAVEGGEVTPPVHQHNFVDGKCECGETDPNYQPPSVEGPAVVVDPAVDTAYKFGLLHGGNGNVNVFFNGENFNNYAWYLAYTTELSEAVDVYLETVEGVEGGYRLYFDLNGVKTYIVAFPRDGDTTKGTLKLDSAVPTEYYTFDTTYNTLIYTSVTGEQFYLGSSGTYKSISLSAISYITSDTSYIAHLYATEGGEVTPPVEGGDDTHEHNFVDGKCECGEEDPNYVPPSEGGDDDGVMSIPEVLDAAEGTAVVVKGTVVEIYQAWNEQYSNISFYIADEAGNRLLVFRTGTLVGIGDQVTVTGKATLYNEVIQIAQGGVTVIDVPHVCSDFTEATCLNAATCTVCGKVSGEPLDHVYVNGKCECGAEEGVSTIKASKTMAELISALGWTSSTTKQSFNLDDVVTVKVNGGSNTGKAYNGDHIRIYATDTPAGTLTISVPEGYELVSVKVTTSTGTYAFLCLEGSTEDISNSVVSVSGNTVVLTSVKNGSDGKQVRVLSIEVEYKAN